MNNAFTRDNSLILSGRKAHHVKNIIFSLSQSSSATTRDIAKSSFKMETIPDSQITLQEIRIREQVIYKLIQGRMYKKSGKKKRGKYPGLIENGYVIETDEIINSKNKPVKKYSLTFRGLFFALGFNFDVSMIESFLQNNSKNNLLCAYLNLALKNTSPKFIQDVFLHPIYSIIVNNKILLDGDLGFYFVNVSQIIGSTLHERVIQINEKYFATNNYQKHMKEINSLIDVTESLMSKTFYNVGEFNSWDESIIEHFYKSESEWNFYKKFSDDRDSRLLYEIMKSIINGYYFAMGSEAPTKPKNRLSLARGMTSRRKNTTFGSKKPKLF
ncbi:hypothetical protein OAQ83_01075 [Nitrosopumilus sp.]|nr:hypothetical protein [Nitrosopumilus sp.]